MNKYIGHIIHIYVYNKTHKSSTSNNTNILPKKKGYYNYYKIIYCMLMDVCSVLFLSCLYICVCVYLKTQVPLRECCSIWSGVCGPSYYCAPLGARGKPQGL